MQLNLISIFVSYKICLGEANNCTACHSLTTVCLPRIFRGHPFMKTVNQQSISFGEDAGDKSYVKWRMYTTSGMFYI